MSEIFKSISKEHQEFIKQQRLFFVATAMASGRVNVSPKGMDTLRVKNDRQVVWLNLTGSGNETATHVLQSARMTIMFCAFEGPPLILRLYGNTKVYHPRHIRWNELIGEFSQHPGARQIFEMEVDMIQTSCGFGVPLMDYRGERELLSDWATKKGELGLLEYWEKKNKASLDGCDTGIFKDTKII